MESSSRKCAFPWSAELNTDPTWRTTAVATFPGDAMRKDPAAAPMMITTSAGWTRTERFPCSIRYPPMTEPSTTNMPTRISKGLFFSRRSSRPSVPRPREEENDVHPSVPRPAFGVGVRGHRAELRVTGGGEASGQNVVFHNEPREDIRRPDGGQLPVGRVPRIRDGEAVRMPLHDRVAPGFFQHVRHCGERHGGRWLYGRHAGVEKNVLADREDKAARVLPNGHRPLRAGRGDDPGRVALEARHDRRDRDDPRDDRCRRNGRVRAEGPPGRPDEFAELPGIDPAHCVQ